MTPAADGLAACAAALFAVDPAGLGGVHLRAAPGAARERWLESVRALLPENSPWRRVPLQVGDDRLLGGLDLAATLHAGRPVAQRGLLAEADGGVLLLTMAERVSGATAAAVTAVLDTHELVAERHGIGMRSPSRLGVIALDEGLDDDERAPAALRERLAFWLTLAPRPDGEAGGFSRADVAAAREQLDRVRIDDACVEGLCAAALALGVDSLRAPLFACRVARIAAALDGREAVAPPDAALAAALVLAPRATRVPAPRPPDPDEADDAPPEAAPQRPGDAAAAPPPPAPSVDADGDATAAAPPADLEELVLEAALAALPAGLLAALAHGPARASRAASAGRAGALLAGSARGRRTGVRRGAPGGGARLNLIETLRAAAPWQALRRREEGARAPNAPRVRVRREDFHVWRFEQRRETTTVFVVDASGSAALHRLAEAKGAVELLLADCYVRRDSVAVIAFRGAGAELLLPPTRSLVRAKRSLAGLPGGGGTPLAAGIAAAHTLATSVARRGATPVVVLLTDGRANIARDGSPGRARAGDDALAAARLVHAEGIAALLLDTSPQPQEPARLLAAAMGARYLPLPHAGAATLSQAVRGAGAGAP